MSDELERLDREASAAPWHAEKTDRYGLTDYCWEVKAGLRETVAESLKEADARLIVALRNALPDLIAELRQWRNEQAAAESNAYCQSCGKAGYHQDGVRPVVTQRAQNAAELTRLRELEAAVLAVRDASDRSRTFDLRVLESKARTARGTDLQSRINDAIAACRAAREGGET